MKTVLICSAQAPFVWGGAEILVSELRSHLERRGFRVDVAAVPFKWYPSSELVRQALVWRMLDVTESNGTPVDLVIPTKFRRSWDEATWTRFERTFDSKGALIKLEPKEKVQARHGRSPDTFDADILAMRAPDMAGMFGQTGGLVLGPSRNGNGQPIRNGRLRPTHLNGARKVR